MPHPWSWHRIAAPALADQIPGLRSAIRAKLPALSRACGTGVPLETALYLPVKRFLENLGFTVKGEVGGCDLVALSAGEPPIVVIGELKLSFNLELLLQAVDLARACDEVLLASKKFPRCQRRQSYASDSHICLRSYI